MNQYLNIAIYAALKAGKEILKIYNFDDFKVQLKSDDSPVTKADLEINSHLIFAIKKYS